MLAGLFLLISCQKIIPNAQNNSTPTNFSQVFDAFWNDMSTNYLYWDIDTTNWDAVYSHYKPIFTELNLQSTSDVRKSVNYFRQITKGLIDSHYAITFTQNSIVDSLVYPALDRKKNSPNFHSPFLYSSVDSNYLNNGFMSGKYLSSSNIQITTLCGTINNKILYFYCSGFYLFEAYTANFNNGAKTTLQYFFNQLQHLPTNIKGLVIDLRNNNGGKLEDLDFFMGHLIDKPLHFGYAKYKTGNGRFSYTPWIDVTINTQSLSTPIEIPIIVMADSYSISLAEAVTMAIRAMPNTTFVGETTWGATGPITNNIVYDDGQFSVTGFLSVYTSSSAFKYVDGKIYEEKGFPPDIAVPFNLASLYAGKDLQLDKAISLIK